MDLPAVDLEELLGHWQPRAENPLPSGPAVEAARVLVRTCEALAGPPATAAAPYQVSFTVNATALEGITPADVEVLRNGVAVEDCTDPTAAVPDPCVVSRSAGPGGDALVTVRTSQFRTWTLRRVSYDLNGPFQPVDAAQS